MTAKQAFKFVVGLVLLFLVEGLIAMLRPAFPLGAVMTAQGGVAGGIVMTKLLNDLGEMRHGIRGGAGGEK